MDSDVDILLSAKFILEGCRFILLRRAAIIFLLLRSAAMMRYFCFASFAAVERLFSEAGLILTKLRRRLDPGKLKALVYIKYASKYTDLYNLVCPGNSPESSGVALPSTSMYTRDYEIEDDGDILCNN